MNSVPLFLSLFGERDGKFLAGFEGASVTLFDDDLGPVGRLAGELTWDFDVFSKSKRELECYVVDVYRASGGLQPFV